MPALRSSEGVTPVWALNAREKCAWEEKPQRAAISLIGVAASVFETSNASAAWSRWASNRSANDSS